LQDVVGSVERCSDYTRSFLPLKDGDQQRWTRVKQAFDDSKPLPPIQVVRLGQAYFVIDGHHRVSVARQLGLSHLEAQVLQAETQTPVDDWTCCTQQ
jgi:ParB-like chromosome segregation protein Spo0J